MRTLRVQTIISIDVEMYLQDGENIEDGFMHGTLQYDGIPIILEYRRFELDSSLNPYNFGKWQRPRSKSFLYINPNQRNNR